jgi:predicted flavoprotein YhiN
MTIDADILIIGGGAAGLMAGIGAAEKSGNGSEVTILEKMPRPGRKIMITGKGRCNFTNLKKWNEFEAHIRTNPNFLRPAFYNFPPEAVIGFMEKHGLKTVVERGDRAFPESHKSMDVVDTLRNSAVAAGVRLVVGCEVASVSWSEEYGFSVKTSEGKEWSSKKLIIATGGLSYPVTGSTGDGYSWAKSFGHTVKPLFPSLTALVPDFYKIPQRMPKDTSVPKGFDHRDSAGVPELRWHIDRTTPLSSIGKALCGNSLKNVGVTLESGGNVIQEEFGDIDFTDGGIEGPIGFEISRNCVKALINGGKPVIVIDMKPGVEASGLAGRIKSEWDGIRSDKRSSRLNGKEMYRILLGKLMPWTLIPGFQACFPSLMRSRKDDCFLDIKGLTDALKSWRMPVSGYVGFERCVVTAGGVSTDEVLPKTMESRLRGGLYLCGEVLDIDSDTGGYNLQTAFCTGMLAGQSAARSLE